MGNGFDVEAPGADDFVGMLVSLEGRLERRTIARALGVTESELDLIGIGHAPDAEAGERLRTLYELAQRTEGNLDDPGAILQAAHAATLEGRLLVPFYLVPRLRTFIVAFFVFDAIVLGLVVLIFAVR